MQSHHFSPITDLKLRQGPRSHGDSPGLLWSIAKVRGGVEGTGGPLVFIEERRGWVESGYVIVWKDVEAGAGGLGMWIASV